MDHGRSAGTSFIILDAQSVKNSEPAEHRGYDGANALLVLNHQQFDLVQRVMADGYTGDDFVAMVKSTIGADVVIAKQSDLAHGQITLQRWVMERSFAWLGKYRRLWRNCERKLQNSLFMVVLAFIRVLLKRS